MAVDYANLSILIGSCTAALTGLIYAIQKSKCSHIECGCVKCEREVQAVEANDVEAALENTIPLPSISPQRPDNSWIKKS